MRVRIDHSGKDSSPGKIDDRGIRGNFCRARIGDFANHVPANGDDLIMPHGIRDAINQSARFDDGEGLQPGAATLGPNRDRTAQEGQ